ncbi:MAG: DUF1653 domain-containing protein, partial [Enterovibrio sp.]
LTKVKLYRELTFSRVFRQKIGFIVTNQLTQRLNLEVFMDVIDAIYARRSVKHFSSAEQIPKEDVRQLLSAAMLSPTAFNLQHWRFVVISDPALREQIQAHAYGQSQITQSSLLIALCADLKAWEKSPQRYWSHAPENIQQIMLPAIELYYRGNAQAERDEALRSCGIAAQSLMLAAQSMGYDSCPMVGFDFAQVGKLIHLPADHILTMMIAVGKAAAKPWARGGHLPFDEVVITNTFAKENAQAKAQVLGNPSAAESSAEIEAFRAGVYQHFKGAYYLAIGLAREDSTNETVVVYTRLYERDGLPFSTRTLKEWNSCVTVKEQTVARFTYVGQMNK